MGAASLWIKRHRRVLIGTFLGLLGGVVVIQLFYPQNRLVPFATIESVSVSGWLKEDAVWELNHRSASQSVDIYFGKNDTAHVSPVPALVGLQVDHAAQVEHFDYPWYMRLIPSSILWQHWLSGDEEPIYHRDLAVLNGYIKKNLGESCNVQPKNASLIAKQATLAVVPSVDGGVCRLQDVTQALSLVQPRIGAASRVTIPVKVTTAAVSDDTAKRLAGRLQAIVDDGVALKVSDSTQVISASEVMQWLVFTAQEKDLTVSVDAKKAGAYFAEQVTPKLTKPAGVTKVTTRDFAEVSRQDGPKGQTLDVDKTIGNLHAFLDGDQVAVEAVPLAIPAAVRYTRTYTSTSNGIAALFAHYAEDHKGVYGVSFAELGGAGRNADYGGGRDFTAASTYKLFVAYGALKKVEAGEWKWGDQVADGRDMAACFDDMIVKSDNPCAEVLLKRYGYNDLTRDIQKLGLTGSRFASDGPHTTANDLRLFLTKLETNQLGLKKTSSSRLLDAMRRNQFRQGVPAGTTGRVADKVGFLEGLLHDAAVVYDSSGTYVLVVMTDGSSWANIADLTKQLEALRAQ